MWVVRKALVFSITSGLFITGFVSSQGASEFEIYDRLPPHNHKGVFKISGASSTDGIDVTSVALGSIFPQGVFLVHNGGTSILAAPWQSVATSFNLTVDTSWNPRGDGNPQPSPTSTPATSPTPTGGGKPGDANGDGAVDGVDYVIWLNHYNKQTTGADKGDFDGNGIVDGPDYVIWLNHYNK